MVFSQANWSTWWSWYESMHEGSKNLLRSYYNVYVEIFTFYGRKDESPNNWKIDEEQSCQYDCIFNYARRFRVSTDNRRITITVHRVHHYRHRNHSLWSLSSVNDSGTPLPLSVLSSVCFSFQSSNFKRVSLERPFHSCLATVLPPRALSQPTLRRTGSCLTKWNQCGNILRGAMAYLGVPADIPHTYSVMRTTVQFNLRAWCPNVHGLWFWSIEHLDDTTIKRPYLCERWLQHEQLSNRKREHEIFLRESSHLTTQNTNTVIRSFQPDWNCIGWASVGLDDPGTSWRCNPSDAPISSA